MTSSETGEEKPAKPYFLYLLECRDGSYYAGIAVDVEERFEKHLSGKGAAYTRARPPVRILGTQQHPSRSAALKAEYAIKQLPKSRKLAFLRQPV